MPWLGDGHSIVDGYGTRPKPLKANSRAAKAARRLRSRTPAKIYACDTLLKRLAQGLEDLAAEFGQLIQDEHAVVRPRHLARHRHVARRRSTPQPRSSEARDMGGS